MELQNNYHFYYLHKPEVANQQPAVLLLYWHMHTVKVIIALTVKWEAHLLIIVVKGTGGCTYRHQFYTLSFVKVIHTPRGSC